MNLNTNMGLNTRFIVLILSCMLSLVSGQTFAAEQSAQSIHQPWNKLLQEFVHPIRDGQSTAVDYSGFKKATPRLEAYLNDLAVISKQDFKQMKPNDQLAFLINAYNAWTISLVLKNYPNIESIKDYGSFWKSPWSLKIVKLFDTIYTLDDIEHNLIRDKHFEAYGLDPRIHFAVNCASIGCPALATHAYEGDKLEQQLNTAAETFLSDNERNRLDGKTFKVSPIFKWYEDDFTAGWQDTQSVSQFLLYYGQAFGLDKAQVKQRRSQDIAVDYTEYNWNLNDHSGS